MATQTFDLNAALEKWRNELAARPQLLADDRRELERHLADSMADLQARGLGEEESFWLASRRIGQPRQLAEEFEKADPQKVWRERAFWMVSALLGWSLWGSLVDIGIQLRHWGIEFQGQMLICQFALINVLPIIVLLLAQRWDVKNVTAFLTIFKTRWRFAVSMILFIAVTHGYAALGSYHFIIQFAGRFGRQMSGQMLEGFWLNQFIGIGFPAMLLALAVWLLPTQKQLRRMERPA